MKRMISLLILSLTLFTACKKEPTHTEPKKDPTPVETAEPTEKLVPMDHFDKVDEVWQSALSAVISCVQKRVDETKQKGLEGYVIIQAKIGLKPNPIDIKIKEQKLDIDQIEPCIVEYLSQLEFPTWGYWAHSQYSFQINVGY